MGFGLSVVHRITAFDFISGSETLNLFSTSTARDSTQSQPAMSRSLQSLASMPQPQLLQQIQLRDTQMPPGTQPGVPTLKNPAQSKPAVPQDSMFKNRLQEYAQKAAISLPSYHTINEGSSHAPQFRSTVVFNGATYTSPKVFSHRKAAEMDVARIALLSLAPQMSLLTSGHLRPLIREQSCSLVQEDTIFCKQILNEYAVKINVQNPVYNTEKSDDPLPGFVTSLTFNGKHYVGDKGRNKKESQQLVARDVILTILDSDARTVIAKIIKSKRMLSATNNKVKVMPGKIQTISTVGTCASKENELKVVMVNDNMPRTAIPEPCTGNLSNVSAKAVPLHEFRFPKQEALPVEGNATRIIFVPPNSELGGSTSVKKRKRKPKKAKNKVGIDSQVKIAEVSPSRNTCTVAQSVPNNCFSLQCESTGFGNAVLSGT